MELIDKKVLGRVAFIGETDFAPGKWIGVVLDEPKGKNNGVVQGRQYFECPDNFGIFVRQAQVRVLEDSSSSSGIRPPSNTSSTTSLHSTSTDAAAVSPSSSTPAGQVTKSISLTQIKPPSSRTMGQSLIQTPTQSSTIPVIPSATAIQRESSYELEAQVKDLKEKLETLMMKRAEDKAKLKEFEKTKIQLQQLLEYKKQMQETHSELQKQLTIAKKEAKEAIEEKQRREDETKDLEEAAEIATLDKEMAEEKYEQVVKELEAAKERLEEVTLDLEILRGEIDAKGTEDGAATSYQVKQLESKNEQLTSALLRLRDISNEDKAELSRITKEIEKLKSECSNLQKSKDKLGVDNKALEDQIVDLKEQVDSALGAEEMVQILTDKNLALEDEKEKLTEDRDVLEKLLETNEQLLEAEKETVKEILEEKDLVQGQLNQLVIDKASAHSIIDDFQRTISQYRDLVTKLKEENDSLKNETQESLQQAHKVVAQEVEHNQENVEYKIRFHEQKAKDMEAEARRLMDENNKLQIELSAKSEDIKKLNGSIEELRARNEVKELEVSQLKKALKEKVDEAAEAKIRRDLAEKKLSSSSKDSDDRTVKLEKELHELKIYIKNKEREYEETMSHYESDIAALESEKGELKDRLKGLSKKTMDTSSLSMGISPISSPGKPLLTSRASLSSIGHVNEDLLLLQLNGMRKALERVKRENYALKLDKTVRELEAKRIPPLHKPSWLLKITKQENAMDPKRERLGEIQASIEGLRREVSKFMIKEATLDFSNDNRKNQLLQREIIVKKYYEIEKQVVNFLQDFPNDLVAQTQMKAFNSISLRKFLSERTNNIETAPIAARITLPSCKSEHVSLEVSWRQLQRLHTQLL